MSLRAIQLLALLAFCGCSRQQASADATPASPPPQPAPAAPVAARAGSPASAPPSATAGPEVTTHALASPVLPGAQVSPYIGQEMDLQRWRQDPEAYLRTTSPGRVFQTAAPDGIIPALERRSAVAQHVNAGGGVVLAVRAVPDAPVNWMTGDQGLFQQTGVSSATMRADADGIATVTYVATAGAHGEVRILVGSPQAVGQIEFIVIVD